MSLFMRKLSSAILVALLFSCTLALFGPAQMFLTNSLEFNFSFSQLLPFLGIVAFGIFLLLALFLVLLPNRFSLHERGVAVVFTLGLLLWFQGNFLVWKYGLLNGHEIDWGKKVVFGLIDTPLWIACLFLAAYSPAFFYRRVKALSLLLLSIQLLVTAFFFINQPELPSFKKFQIITNNKYDFSKRKNVIILVLDSFQSDVFQEVIDRDPSYKDYFRDFTYFRNTTGGFPSTYAAVPFMLTSQYYNNTQPMQSFVADAYLSPSSIPHQLLKRGWEVDFFPTVMKSVFFDPSVISNIRSSKRKLNTAKVAYLLDLTLFRFLPHFLKRVIHNDENWFLIRWGRQIDKADLLFEDDNDDAKESAVKASPKNRKARRLSPYRRRLRRLEALLTKKSGPVKFDAQFVLSFLKSAEVKNDKNVFKFYHLRGIHEPIRMNANLETVNLPLNRPNLVDLARGELKLTHLFLEGLRELGVYENALIFVVGDHGHPYGVHGLRLPASMIDRQAGSSTIPKGVLESGIPLLLVKLPGKQGDFAINDAPASMADIPATVFNELAIEQAGIGEPLFQIPAELPRERRFLYYYWNHSDWKNRYLPEIIEFHIHGNCWLSSSWQATGKIFEPGG